jgi:hypothetical protein
MWGKLEGANAPSETIIPLPLDKGKGIQGIGLLIIKRRGDRLLKNPPNFTLTNSGQKW